MAPELKYCPLAIAVFCFIFHWVFLLILFLDVDFFVLSLSFSLSLSLSFSSLCVSVCVSVCGCVCEQRRKMRNDRVVLTPIINQWKHNTAWLSVTIKDLLLLHVLLRSLLLVLLLLRRPPRPTPSANPFGCGVSPRIMFHRWPSVGGTIVVDHSIPLLFGSV